MSNNSWVCFDCRESYRRDSQYKGDVICAKCNNRCYNIGYRIPVPRKKDIKSWVELRKNLSEQIFQARLVSEKERVRIIHDMEQGIKYLDSLSENKGRELAIKKMKKDLKKRSLAQKK